MSTCVMICTDDSGNVTVGLGDPPADTSDMQPAKSVGDAIAMARHLLTQPQGNAPDQAGMSGQMPGNQGDIAGSPNGNGGGTGPDSQGSTVSSTQDDSGQGNGGDAKAMWDALAGMNLPQN